ncbi:MAG: GNAT family N-acetyltransferase [Candidatus Thiodiazotropha endolucinida]
MSLLKYCSLKEVNEDDLLALLNDERIREHLVEHDTFDKIKLRSWVEDKVQLNKVEGCRVLAIKQNGVLIGWCGIQLEGNDYELAIIIGSSHWGAGKQVFNDLMSWAKELGHKEVVIHLLDSRSEYKYLEKIATEVSKCKIMKRKFTTYRLAVC